MTLTRSVLFRAAGHPLFLALLCLGAMASTGAAQSVAVRGVVIEPRGPVPRVEVRLLGSTREGALSALTDSAGRFSFPTVPAGEWTISARRIGYHAAEQGLTLRAGADTALTLRITAVPQTLDTVAVSASGMPARYGPSSIMETFYERRKRGRGRFFSREDLEASGHSNLQPVLATVPGTRIRTSSAGRIYLNFPRCTGSDVMTRGSGSLRDIAVRQERRANNDATTVALYIDGVQTYKELVPETLRDIKVDDIEAMEVYRGPSELPVEAMGNTCAAIFIWTRRSGGSVLSTNTSTP